jgi:hypothetical protein
VSRLPPEVVRQIKKEMAVEYEAFLREKVADYVIEIWAAEERYKGYLERHATGDLLLCGEYMETKFKELRQYLKELNVLRGGPSGRGSITPEMIERARAYPFTQLYEFKRNAARCPFHEDRAPSFVLLKDNRARCFGACAKTWDTIGFLMEKEGLRFPESVRRLQ